MRNNFKESYNLVYADENPSEEIHIKGFPRHRNEALVYLASGIPGNRVLEIGCGNGSVLYALRDKFKELHGIEFSPVRKEKAEIALKGFNPKIIEADISSELEYEAGYFDLVLWADVIEHVADLWKAMENIKRITAKGGFLITTTPNIAKIKARASFLLGRFPSTSAKDEGFAVRKHEMFDGGHLHYFTFSMLKKLYLKYGFKPIKTIGFGRFGRIHNIYPALLSSSIGIIGKKL